MENQTKKYSISTSDIVKNIMEKHNIHHGCYILLPELEVNVGSHTSSSSNTEPKENHVGVTMITTGYSLIEAPEDLHSVWDAAKLNPISDESADEK